MEPGQGLPLMVIVGGAGILPLVARPLRIPPMVAEILFGIFLAQLGFRKAMTGDWLPFLANLGFLMLMFHAGLEINFKALRQDKPARLVVALGVFCFTLILAYGSARFLGHGFFLALVLSTTSLGLMLPALRELNLAKTPFGQSVLLCATIADFFTLLGLAGFILYSDYGLCWRLIRPLPVFLVFAVVLWGIRLLSWWHPHDARKLLRESDSVELGVRGVFALLFVFVGLSIWLGLEPILGAFLGGCVLSMVFENRGLLEEKMAGFAFGFLIPVFFIHIGLRFPTESLIESDFLLLTGKLLAAALAVKLIPALLLRSLGLSWRACFLAGVLLSARLSLIIAAVALGTEKGLILETMGASILTLALVTASLAPVLFRNLATRWLPSSGD